MTFCHDNHFSNLSNMTNFEIAVSDNDKLIPTDYQDYYYYDETPDLTQGSSIRRTITVPAGDQMPKTVKDGDSTLSPRQGFGYDIGEDTKLNEHPVPVGFDSFPFKVTTEPKDKSKTLPLNFGSQNHKQGSYAHVKSAFGHRVESLKPTPSIFEVGESFPEVLEGNNKLGKVTTEGPFTITNEYNFKDIRDYVNADSFRSNQVSADQLNSQEHLPQAHQSNDGIHQNFEPFSTLKFKSKQRTRLSHIHNSSPSVKKSENWHRQDNNTPIPTKVFVDTPTSRNEFHFSNSLSSQEASGNKQGFHPDSIVFESDFVPILTADSPGPPKNIKQNKNFIRQSNPISFSQTPKNVPPQSHSQALKFDSQDPPSLVRNPTISHAPENYIEPNSPPSAGFSSFTANPQLARGILRPEKSELPKLLQLNPVNNVVLPDSRPGFVDPTIGVLPKISGAPHFPNFENSFPSLTHFPLNISTPNFRNVIVPHNSNFQGASITMGGNLFASPQNNIGLVPDHLNIQSLPVSPQHLQTPLQIPRDSTAGLVSSHFKSPSDPPQTFAIHHLPPTPVNPGPLSLGASGPVQFRPNINIRNRSQGRPMRNRPQRNPSNRGRPNSPQRNPNVRGRPNQPPRRLDVVLPQNEVKDKSTQGAEDTPSFLQSIWSAFVGTDSNSEGRKMEPDTQSSNLG